MVITLCKYHAPKSVRETYFEFVYILEIFFKKHPFYNRFMFGFFKQITGAKAPPMRYLSEWLEQNPLYDVDPKWTDIVKSKVKVIDEDFCALSFAVN